VQLSKWLADVGVDLIDVSTGGAVAHQRVQPGPLYQVPFAAEIRERAGVPTSAVGMINEPADAERVVAEGHADAVMVARAAIRNPNHPWMVAEALGYAPPLPHQFERGRSVR
jgi:2,4-dienoyl-CoA reductase-like NADH-dependent reductase (Old Yellow Enzyme family)